MSNNYSQKGDDMSLKEVLLLLPKIEKYKVSKVARSEGGFLSEFIKNDGDLLKMSDEMLAKRHSFLMRTMGAYDKKATWRRYLSLIAWAYKPHKTVSEPEKMRRGRKRVEKDD